MSQTSLPHNGQIYFSNDKKFNIKIIMVPFFRSKRIQLMRHIEFLNHVGFDVVTFDLKKKAFFKSMMFVWKEQILSILKSVEGDKIIFSFSNPSAAAIWAINQYNSNGIKGLICDSGPSGDFYHSVKGLLRYELKVSQPLALSFLSFFYYYFWSPGWNKMVQSQAQKLSRGFKVLTLEAGKDLLISCDQIEKVFAPIQKNIYWERHLFKDAGHLKALKLFPEEYKITVTNFIKLLTAN